MTKPNQYFPTVVFHPGETLSEKLEEIGMGAKEFAIRTNKPEKTITAILKGESAITAEMAVQFESVLHIPAHFWLNSQRQYDEYLAREKRQATLQESKTWMKCFPVREMAQKGWIVTAQTDEEKTATMLFFFGFSSHTAWEKYYYEQQLKVAFRISLTHTKEPHALSAWLRRGELQAAELQAKPYNERRFREILDDIKSLMAEQPNNFFAQLQALCLEAGVKVVHTPCLAKAPINGATRWLNDTPLIQLSNRRKQNDIFWFTFFHEVGHILLHGKKDIFLEDIEYSEKDLKKEAEADAFAMKWTFSEEQEQAFLQKQPISVTGIIQFAKQINTHPALIIGRLQKRGLIHYSAGRQLMVSIEI